MVSVQQKQSEKLDEDVQLIYISGYEEYALQLFEVSPVGFLKKPLYPDQFRQMPEESVGYSGDKIIVFFL